MKLALRMHTKFNLKSNNKRSERSPQRVPLESCAKVSAYTLHVI